MNFLFYLRLHRPFGSPEASKGDGCDDYEFLMCGTFG